MDIIDHIALPVQDIKKAVEWYTQQFACVIEYQDETWALLRFANIKLALIHPSQHPLHAAVLCDHPEKYGTVKTHRDGSVSSYFKDLDGNEWEMVKY
jgi:catechol 2,3-dioxygenase-like lactoylglutathione lyase family enzyme